MNATAHLTADARGILIHCPQCHRTNRIPFARLHQSGHCGTCKTALHHPSLPVEIDSAASFTALIQEIVTALAEDDFYGVAKSASRIGYSEQMGRTCSHMGAGAPGFTETALNFHRTADAIGSAAKQRDAGATLKAVSATLQTCVGCHATYRQEIVDEAKWTELTESTR
jgi:hypothetical protein